MRETPHRLVNPAGLAPPRGFSHAVAAAPGRLVFVAGQTGHDADEAIGEDFVEQFDRALANVNAALEEAGASTEHLVQLMIYVTDLEAYRARRSEIGEAYRRHLGRHFPAMALLGVSELVDARAKVELVGVAVVP